MTDRPNVVVVTVDSLRADHCSFAGYGRETTPALDRLAADGLVFDNAVAPGPSTPESMPAIFTGRDGFGGDGEGAVAEMRSAISRHMSTRDTVPEKFARRGYTTIGFTPNPFTSRYFGFDAGFDHFQDFMGSFVRRRYARFFREFFEGTPLSLVARIGMNFLQREEVFKPWEAYYDDALARVEAAAEPYFLWVHLMDAHVPYLTPRAYRSQSWWEMYYGNVQFWRGDTESPFDDAVHDRLVTGYDDAVRYVDAFLDRLTTDLDGDEPVVVVHGDHGEAFGEHGAYGHEAYLYEENIHVPFVVGGVEDGTVEAPVSLRSLPTVLTTVVDGDQNPDGSSFAVSRTPSGGRTALRGRRLKYIENGSDDELYDLARDEQSELSDESVRAACRRRLDRIDAAAKERRIIGRAAGEVTDR